MAGKKKFGHIFRRIFSRWYFFLIALCITMPLAYLYLRLSPAQYMVKASLLLSKEPVTDLESEKSVKDAGAAISPAGITDEIGILKSFSMIDRTLKELDFGITIYTIKDYVKSEKYGDAPFTIVMDSAVNQIIEVPIYIERLSSTRFKVRASGKSVKLYNFYTDQVESVVKEVDIEQEVAVDKPFVNKYLSFSLKFNEKRKAEDDGMEMYFILNSSQAIAEQYQRKLSVLPLSPESEIAELSITGPVASKEKKFITKLIDVYLKDELQKENQLALRTIDFINHQLEGLTDTTEANHVRNYLLEKRVEARIALASNSVEKVVVDKPYVVAGGDAVWPRRDIVMFLGFAGGLLFAFIFIVLKDALNDNLITQDDVEENTKIPFIGTISHASKREQNSIVAHARSPVGESFRSLRVNLQYLTLGSSANVIGITSSRESEGKTFCSVNLAAVMAYSGRRTILVDTDMRRPRVASYFQLENRKGLSNFLVGDGSIKEIINNTDHKGFDVITSGPIPPNPIDLIGNPRMEELINSLKQTYSTIILDSPPVGYVSEYIILMKYTDANLYIVRSDYTNRNSLKKINKLFERKKLNNFSVLLNDVKPTKSSGYGYSYGYGYGYKY